MRLVSSRIPINTFELNFLDPITTHVRQAYINMFGMEPAKPGGWYGNDDWIRISFVLNAIYPWGTVLDVGVGAGQFLNALALSQKFRRVAGVDFVRYEKYLELHPAIERMDCSIEELPYADNSFDIVTCMEVLEHIPDPIFEPALAELRRVCRGQLIITVPFNEPEPISKFHVRRFQADDILRIFPNSNRILLDRSRMPWILIEEWPFDPRGASEHYSVRICAVEAILEKQLLVQPEAISNTAEVTGSPTRFGSIFRWPFATARSG